MSTTTALRKFPVFGLFLALGLYGQQTAPTDNQPRTTVPRLVRISNSFHPTNGMPLSPIEGVTLSIYREETGGTPLWQETQNVSVDAEGRYRVMMGSTLTDGVPLELFTSSEPRWLGVQFQRQGETEQPRVRLASVPYALKAVDAETLGGLPASAYLLNPVAGAVAGDAAGSPRGLGVAVSNAVKAKPKVDSGVSNCIAAFTSATDVGCSTMWQAGTSVGLNTQTPGATLDVQSSAAGFASLLNIRGTNGAGVGAAGVTLSQQNSSMLMRAYTPGAPGLLANSIGWFALNGSNKLFIGHAGGSVGNDVQFFTNNQWNNPQLTLTQAGNFGVGTTTPAFNLDVAGNINFGGGVFYQGASVFAVPGGAANGNTAVGVNALLSGSAGHNTAMGYQALNANSTGFANTAVGYGALAVNTTGGNNAALGGLALNSNTGGNNGTALGFHTLMSNTTGNNNTAVGGIALASNSTGGNNTAVGQASMFNNITGCCNVGVGQAALNANTTGNANTAVGGSALQNNNANNNTAVGQAALMNNTTGCCNTAVGQNAMSANVTGTNNTAIGNNSLTNNIANGNTAVGVNAMQANTIGFQNMAIGLNTLHSNTTGSGNTAVGQGALGLNTTGSSNIALGQGAGFNVDGGSNNIHIGNSGSAADSNLIKIGTSGTQSSFFSAGIRGVTTANNDAVAVVIDSAGQLGTVSSSRRYKEDIHDMADASSGLMRLRPVTYRYKKPFADGSKPLQYGLIAEEVAEVYPELIARSADGQIETVKYQVLDSMILNEVQRQQRAIEQQKQQIELQESRLNAQQLEIESLKLKLSALSTLESRLATLESAVATGNH